MKFKTSAIALAVAGTVATPMAAQADLYASARVGVESYDTGDVSDLRTRSFGSRFGVRSETDLGNGMTGFGRYEWDVDFTDHNEDSDDDIDVRHRYVGLKGDFGSLTLGQAYHTYYNMVYGPTDSPWWGSGYFYPSPGRTDHGVTYAGAAGNINFGITGYFLREAEEDAPDVIEVAASFGIGDMTLGVGAITTEADAAAGTGELINGSDEDVVGVVLHGIAIGDTTLGVGFQNQDDDDAFVIDWSIGNILVHIEQASLDAADADPNSVTLSYTQSLGRKTTAWYELVSTDADSGDSDDDLTVIRGVLKYDIE